MQPHIAYFNGDLFLTMRFRLVFFFGGCKFRYILYGLICINDENSIIQEFSNVVIIKDARQKHPIFF